MKRKKERSKEQKIKNKDTAQKPKNLMPKVTRAVDKAFYGGNCFIGTELFYVLVDIPELENPFYRLITVPSEVDHLRAGDLIELVFEDIPMQYVDKRGVTTDLSGTLKHIQKRSMPDGYTDQPH